MPNLVINLQFISDDLGLVKEQLDLNLIRAPEAWCITHGSRNITVGITDSYFDLNHVELVEGLIF